MCVCVCVCVLGKVASERERLQMPSCVALCESLCTNGEIGAENAPEGTGSCERKLHFRPMQCARSVFLFSFLFFF